MRNPLHIHLVRRESRGRRAGRAGAWDAGSPDPAIITAESSAADGPDAPADPEPRGERPSPRRAVPGRGDARVRDRLARALIDEAYGLILHEAQQTLAEARDRLAAAHHEVSAAERELERTRRARLRWRRWRRLDRAGHADRLVAMRAMTIAQLADLADTDVPPGEHLAAVRQYLSRRHPPQPPLDSGPPPAANRRCDPGTGGAGDDPVDDAGPAPGSITDR